MPGMLNDFIGDAWKVPVKFRRLHTDAKLPKYIHSGDAGMDVYLHVSYPPLSSGEIRIIPVGFAVEIPAGYELQVRPRSGLASRGINAHFGTIDSNFRNEVGVILTNNSHAIQPLNAGDRIAQLVLSKVPTCVWEVVDELGESERDGGFGSSGVN